MLWSLRCLWCRCDLLLDHAAANNYGLAAFNVNNMEQIQAIMEAAKEIDAPVIVQASRGARSYSQDAYLRHLMLAAAELYPQIPIVMHQDHGNSPATCKSAIEQNFTSVMMDGSLKEDGKTPADYDYNVNVTTDVVEAGPPARASRSKANSAVWARSKRGMGEKEDGHGAEGKLDHSQLLTDPAQAEDFVRKTKVDALAVAIGTSHGAYKFTRKPTGEVLAMDRIIEIHKRLPNMPHGHARVVERAAGLAGPDQQVRRQDEADLGRAGRGDPARHQERRPQDQRRHRQPHGDDRRRSARCSGKRPKSSTRATT